MADRIHTIDRRGALAGLVSVSALSLLPVGVRAEVVDKVAGLTAKIQPKVIAWRRDIHQHPELSNREVRTAKLVAAELKRLGLEVRTGVGVTGVVGVLKGGWPGPAVALRADMDGLPVKEQTGLPFASQAMGEYEGKAVPVTHACGHDCHVAMLLGAAEILSSLKSELKGTVVFIFQPAEEGPPKGEKGGASLMVAEGALDQPKVSSIFGIHVWPAKTGEIVYRPKGFMAASDRIEIALKGAQTHGAQPWRGIDMTALAAQIVNGINQITARQIDVTEEPSILSLTTMQGGARFNIIPEEMTLGGTMRTFSPERRVDLIKRLERLVKAQCEAFGAKGEVIVTSNAALTYNDPKLASDLHPALVRATGAADKVNNSYKPQTVAEDFSYFQQKVPGLYCFLGICKPDQDPAIAPPNHSPFFDVYEPALEVGVRAHVLAALSMLGRTI